MPRLAHAPGGMPSPHPSRLLAARLQTRLSKPVLEMMLWKLEVHNAAATDRALAFAGAMARRLGGRRGGGAL